MATEERMHGTAVKDRHVGDMSLFINGEWVPGSTGETFETIDPATGEVIGTVPRGTAEDIDRAVKAAKAALPDWSAMCVNRRPSCFQVLGSLASMGWVGPAGRDILPEKQ